MSSSSTTSTLLSNEKHRSDDEDTGWKQQDTVHYLSPATTTRTLNEGDFDYSHFIPGLEQFGPSPLTHSTISCDINKLQRTVAIIKPEAMEFKNVVLKAIIDNGLILVNQRTIHLTPEEVAEVYEQHYGCPSFPNMVVSMSMEPLLVLSLAGVNVVEKWKAMIGPCHGIPESWFLPLSVRKRFGFHEEMSQVLHASDNLKESNRENRYFFSESILEPITENKEKVEDYINLNLRKTLVAGLTEVVKKKPVDPLIFLAEWLLLHNPFQPKLPYLYAMAPT